MADSIREQIIQAFGGRLALIRTAGGYNTNIGASVFRAVKDIDPGALPAVSYFPGAEAVIKRVSGFATMSFNIRAEGIVAFGASNPSVVCEKILADLIKAVTASKFSSKAKQVTYRSGGPGDVPESGQVDCMAFAEFEIQYDCLLGNPYSQ